MSTETPSQTTPVWNDEIYELIDNDVIRRKETALAPTHSSDMIEQSNLIDSIVRYVQSVLIDELGFKELKIPLEDVQYSCPIFTSDNFSTCERLLIIAQNAVGSNPGIWSRSLCMQLGLSAGSMIPCMKQAILNGYGVVILNPNTNSVNLQDEKTEKVQKMLIPNSSSPEEHVLYIWENVIAHCEAQQIVLIGYGNGAILTKELLQRQFVRSRSGLERNRIFGIATIEASHLIEEDDPEDIKIFLRSRAVNWEHSDFPIGFYLSKSSGKLGCTSLSVGDLGENMNVALSVQKSLDGVFRFLRTACDANINDVHVGFSFFQNEAQLLNIDPNSSTSNDDDSGSSDQKETDDQKQANEQMQPNESFFTRFFSRPNNLVDDASSKSRSLSSNIVSNETHQINSKLTVADFDLLKVVGKGAFGKVMLVRKISGDNKGNIYAMKVLKKSVIAAKGQIEHTKHERAILCEIRHPFIVRLRYAFQNDEKLYLVTDYYNGGSLFYHLRKSRGFNETRAKFYAAELLLALEHLHTNRIIYRDLKLENILMDQFGHIALTDFGLSKMDVTDIYANQQTTFCGTAEYIAPELLRGHGYGAAVDWWSFGILLYEMMGVKTPFFDKNRKLMFHRIINSRPQFPSEFSDDARAVLTGLLEKNPAQRLGSGPREALEIKEQTFFSTIDWDLLSIKKLLPPFVPDVKNETDTKYVPQSYLDAEAKDSFVQSNQEDEKVNFAAFTFHGESALSEQEHQLSG